jgi:ankyrin repeat protein
VAAGDDKALLRAHGATPTLHEECHNGNVAAIAQLLNIGANAEAKNGAGSTPLAAAAAGGHMEAVQLLLECGAKAGRRRLSCGGGHRAAAGRRRLH